MSAGWIIYKYSRPRKLMLDAYVADYETTFAYFNTVKRNGFHIVAEFDDADMLVYKTHKGKLLVPDVNRPVFQPTCPVVNSTLAKIDEYLCTTLQFKFDPGNVYVRQQGYGCRLRFEFCVQDKGTGKDNLQALFHGQWAKHPELYDVSIAVFDVEFDMDNGRDPSYDERWQALQEAFPENVVERLETVPDIVDVLKHCEGIVTYAYPQDIPCKVKLDHPVSLRIIAARNNLDEHPYFQGYNQVFIGVQTGEDAYLALDVIDYTEVLSDYEGRLDGRCYVNPQSIHRSKVTGRMECTSTGVLGPVLGELARVLDQSQKWKYRDNDDLQVFSTFRETNVVLSDGGSYKIDHGRSFHFNRGCHFFANPPPIVVSPNDVWTLAGGGIHLQATKVLAVGDFGAPLFKELYARPTSLDTLRRIAVEGLCQNPDEMNRVVFGRDVDLVRGFE